ncbi:hypothetical protein Cgig2_010787 [Carnegiea gigantea]|uniref:Uncharacterized protein n=1 Tax=Carnegiea gigantea TaxID=171969 RepID=A0A9Q1JMF6_9CARY|nr:hypothetical protein Cgig2_010787 [Carnegiea gigantea]
MDAGELQRLREYELRLLRCSVPSPLPNSRQLPTYAAQSPPPDHTFLLLDSIIGLIESGRYVDSLSSDATRAVVHSADSFQSIDPSEFYAGLERAIESYLVDAAGGGDASSRFLVVVSVAVAAFLAFIQCNVTGPVIELPSMPLPWKVVNDGKEWEAWARMQLMATGSELLAKLSALQYIVFAKILLVKSKDLLFSKKAMSAMGFGTTSWWMARILLVQQRILDERCSSLLDFLQVLIGESLNCLGDVEKVTSYWGALIDDEEASTIVSTLQLEAGLVEHTFGRVDHARQHFELAASAVGLELAVTGTLGFRTVHQVEPKAQMVLITNRSSSPSGSSSPSQNPSHQRDASGIEANWHQNHEEIKEASDVLMAPRIMDETGNKTDGVDVVQNGHAADVFLTATQQAVVLAQCLLMEKSARLDELRRWEMAPYIEAIDSQQYSHFSVSWTILVMDLHFFFLLPFLDGAQLCNFDAPAFGL